MMRPRAPRIDYCHDQLTLYMPSQRIRSCVGLQPHIHAKDIPSQLAAAYVSHADRRPATEKRQCDHRMIPTVISPLPPPRALSWTTELLPI